MRIFIWILIIVLFWIIITPVNEGLKKIKIKKPEIKKPEIKKPNLNNIKKTITKVANKVGGAITKVATSGLDSNAKKVLKNMGKIKESIRSFTKKGGDEHIPIPMQSSVPLSGTKCKKV